MAYKIYKKGAFILVENTVTGDLKEINSQYVQIAKAKASLDKYEVLENGVSRLSVALADIQDENGAGYSESAWDIFRYEQCGSVNSSEVANPYPAPTTVEVDISSAQILAMGSTPIELLPAAGAGKYYDIESIIFEYNYITSNYTTTSDYLTIKYGSYEFGFVSSFIKTSSFDSFAIISRTPSLSIDPVFVPATAFFPLNSGVTIETFDTDDPTNGDGTIRVIITYTTRTFGA
jgi:hypothetical protein